MSDGDAVVQPQRAEVRDVQPQSEAVVVIKIAGEGIRSRAHRAGVAEQRKTHAGAVVLFQDGNAVFQRTEPVAVAANRFIGHIRVGAIRWVTRTDVPVFETAQRVRTAEIIPVIKWHGAGTQAAGNADAPVRFEHMALEKADRKSTRL